MYNKPEVPRAEKMSRSDSKPKLGRKRINKSVAALCCSVFIMFTAMEAVYLLQSTMNLEKGIGVASLAVGFACVSVISLFLPAYVIKKIGCKHTLTLSLLAYSPFVLANFYPHWFTMVPAAVVLGLASALFWGASNTYLSQLASIYAIDLDSEMRGGSTKTNMESKGLNPKSFHKGEISKCITPSENAENPISLILSKLSESLTTVNDGHNKTNQESNVCSNSSMPDKTTDNKGSNEKVLVLDNNKCEMNKLGLNSCQTTQNEADILDTSDERQSQEEDRDMRIHEPTFNDVPNDVGYLESATYDDKEVFSATTSNVGASNSESAKYNEELPVNTCPSILRNVEDTPSNFESAVYKKEVPENLCNNNSLIEVAESARARFFGFNGMAFLSTNVMCFLLAYYILVADRNLIGEIGNSTCICGSGFCNVQADCFKYNILQPSTEIRYAFSGSCMVLNLIAALFVALFVEPLDDTKEAVTFNLNLALATIKHMLTKEALLLIPMIIVGGMIQAFYVADFTKSYVACAWGTYHVGLVSVCFGVSAAISTTLIGHVTKYLRRLTVFLIGAIIDVACFVFLLVWQPDAEQSELFFLVAAMFGVSVSIFWSQFRAFYGDVFEDDEEAAFANFGLWNAFGHSIVFGMSDFMCTSVKIYIQLAAIALGIVGYILVEPDISHRRRNIWHFITCYPRE